MKRQPKIQKNQSVIALRKSLRKRGKPTAAIVKPEMEALRVELDGLRRTVRPELNPYSPGTRRLKQIEREHPQL